MVYPANAGFINVISSVDLSEVGRMPPATGMPVYMDIRSRVPYRIDAINPDTGLVTVGPSGALARNEYQNYPFEVNVLDTVAVAYGWPSGVGHIKFANQHFTLPSGTPRGEYLGPGGVPYAG